MKAIYECEWCSFLGTAEVVESHERNCKYNPKNINCKLKRDCDDEYTPTYKCFEGQGAWKRI